MLLAKSCGLLGLLLATALPARAQLGEVELAQKLVRAHYFEGLPYSRARELTAADVDVLVEMLEDPTEAEYHANIVMALGISGSPQAYSALAQFHEDSPEGEVDAAEYRARRALPLAMGHLARSDSRAFGFLVRLVRGETTLQAPGWRYRHLARERLEGVLRRAAITGLAISGRLEALAVLRELDERSRADPAATGELRTHIRETQEFANRVIREGPDRVFGADSSP